MRRVVRHLRDSPRANVSGQLVRYGIVVGFGYLLAIAIYSGELAIGVPAYAGLGVAFVLNGLFNFVLVRLWAFPPSGRGVRSDFARFCTVAAMSFALNYASFALLYSVLGLGAATAQRLAIVIAAPATFFANRVWSFRSHRLMTEPHEDDARASAKNDSYSRM